MQAPQLARSQTRFGPVTSSRLRRVSSRVERGSTVTLRGKADFLVCADICIPESANLELKLPVAAGPAPADPAWGGKIAKALAEAPKPAGLTAAFQAAGGTLKLAITGAPLKGADASGAYFFPFSGTVIDHAKPQAIERVPRA